MRQEKQTPLTLEGLVDYNEKVFLPALENHFASKKDLRVVEKNLKDEVTELRDDFVNFKDETRAYFDAVI